MYFLPICAIFVGHISILNSCACHFR